MLPDTSHAAQYAVYPKSIQRHANGYVFMMLDVLEDVLVATHDATDAFQGDSSSHEMDGKIIQYKVLPLDHATANSLRSIFSFTKPQPIPNHKTTIGLGDRLGLAGNGHLRAIQAFNVHPVLAQQTVLENQLTHRSFEDVLDVATCAVFKAGYQDGFSADADQLKTAHDIEKAIGLGYTAITLDLSRHIDDKAFQMPTKDILNAYHLNAEETKRYLDQPITVEDIIIHFDEESLIRIILGFRKAIEVASEMYDNYIKNSPHQLHYELSFFHMKMAMEPNQHYYIANELKLRGIDFQWFAPRFYGEFPLGIDYIGDIEQFEEECMTHAAIARSFDHRLSVHAASEKFSVLDIIGKHTKGMCHLKTSGTSWLLAIQLIAMKDPKLYRTLHAYALSVFVEATEYYPVHAIIKRIPKLELLTDDELPELFRHNDVRQMLHITYGEILHAKNEFDEYIFRTRLIHIIKENELSYAQMLEKHIQKHLELICKAY